MIDLYPDPAAKYTAWRNKTGVTDFPSFVKLLCIMQDAIGFGPERILDFGYGWGVSATLWLTSFPNATVSCCDPSGQGGYSGDDPVSRLPESCLKRWNFTQDSIENVLKPNIDPFDFIFIDADHGYPSTLIQVGLSWDVLIPGGVLAGHDWKIEKVRRSVIEFANENDLVYQVWNEDNGGWMIRKKGVREWATLM